MILSAIRNTMIALMLAAMVVPANAQLVSTGDALALDSGQLESRIEAFLLQDEVAAELAEYGVSHEMAMARVANMSAAELQQVAGSDAPRPARCAGRVHPASIGDTCREAAWRAVGQPDGRAGRGLAGFAGGGPSGEPRGDRRTSEPRRSRLRDRRFRRRGAVSASRPSRRSGLDGPAHARHGRRGDPGAHPARRSRRRRRSPPSRASGRRRPPAPPPARRSRPSR